MKIGREKTVEGCEKSFQEMLGRFKARKPERVERCCFGEREVVLENVVSERQREGGCFGERGSFRERGRFGVRDSFRV